MNKEYYHFNFWDTVVFLTVFLTIADLLKIWIGERKTIIIKNENEDI